MSVVRPQRAISAGVEVPPSSLLHTTEYFSTRWRGVAAGSSSCQATSGASVTAFWWGRAHQGGKSGQWRDSRTLPRLSRTRSANATGRGTGTRGWVQPEASAGDAHDLSALRRRRSVECQVRRVPARRHGAEVEIARDQRGLRYDDVGHDPAVERNVEDRRLGARHVPGHAEGGGGDPHQRFAAPAGGEMQRRRTPTTGDAQLAPTGRARSPRRRARHHRDDGQRRQRPECAPLRRSRPVSTQY